VSLDCEQRWRTRVGAIRVRGRVVEVPEDDEIYLAQRRLRELARFLPPCVRVGEEDHGAGALAPQLRGAGAGGLRRVGTEARGDDADRHVCGLDQERGLGTRDRCASSIDERDIPARLRYELPAERKVAHANRSRRGPEQLLPAGQGARFQLGLRPQRSPARQRGFEEQIAGLEVGEPGRLFAQLL
jgi:hypothetical protein